MNIANFIELNTEHDLQEQVDEALELGENKRIKLFKGLTLIVKKKQKGEYIFRAQKNGKRSQIKLGKYKKNCTKNDIQHKLLDIKSAIFVAKKLQDQSVLGLDPVSELRSEKYSVGTTVDAIFLKVLNKKKHTTSSTDAFELHYENEVQPYIGNFCINQIVMSDIQVIINRVLDSGRKAVAEKTLGLCKNLFEYGEANNICLNVTRTMTVNNNAGGKSEFKGIALADHDLERVFTKMKELSDTFCETLYYYSILLVSLGVRKSELLKAKWSDYDTKERLLHIERVFSKAKIAIAVPVSQFLQPILDKVKVLSNGSDYLFPSAKKSKNGHLCTNTPNSALKRLHEAIANLESNEKFQVFTVHDLRRTFRTMLSRKGVSNQIAELCINHREPSSDHALNTVDRYDRYVRLEERRAAHDLIAEKIMELANEEEQVQMQLQLVA
jgi:integrase